MAQVRTASAPLVLAVQVVAPPSIGETAVAALRARGLEARIATDANDASDELIALALDAPPTAAHAVELAASCARAAAQGRPMCVFAPPPRGAGRAAIERSAALACLRASGAVLAHDVDAWLEAIVALVCFGLPAGPRAAVIAPPGSWLEAQTQLLVAEAEGLGARPPQLAGEHTRAKAEPTDVVLFDPALTAPPAQLPGNAIAMHVVGRGEHASTAMLHGMRGALAAIDTLGRAAERIAAGIGPADTTDRDELGIDRGELEKRVTSRLHGIQRVGDHDTKALLRAYGVAITRQLVSTTPSSAVQDSKRVGYPVEMKPFGNDVLPESEGTPVERGITSDALVRRAFTSVLVAAGRDPTADGAAVIVRETPPLGRDVSAHFLRLASLGWTVVLEVNGQVAAAPAPLRAIDAHALAASIVASRAADAEPDRAGLAMLLRRASHLVVDLGEKLVKLELPRIVVGGRGARTVVVDAWCELA